VLTIADALPVVLGRAEGDIIVTNHLSNQNVLREDARSQQSGNSQGLGLITINTHTALHESPACNGLSSTKIAVKATLQAPVITRRVNNVNPHHSTIRS
jgi:hypothetical protein